MKLRIGQGWDSHRLVGGRRLVLGGVVIPAEFGEDGHSDGDVLLHALTDAMLGACAAGDIGRHFPPGDGRWRDSPSAVFVAGALELLTAAGYHLVNIDSTVILERPRLAGHIEAIRAAIAALTGLPLNAVSVKAKTSEGMDAAGRGEAISAMVVVLVDGSAG
jgi:2-C-methyl-D-erythritol 2,4-cyclodiphosphate synthase